MKNGEISTQVSGRFQGQLFNPQNIVNNSNPVCVEMHVLETSNFLNDGSEKRAFISLQCK